MTRKTEAISARNRANGVLDEPRPANVRECWSVVILYRHVAGFCGKRSASKSVDGVWSFRDVSLHLY
jgi:hypothetical protein